MIETIKLRVFRVVTDTMNPRRATGELHLTQPAVPAQIKSLEESLGIELLDRIGRDVNLTPTARILLEYARQILQRNGNGCLVSLRRCWLRKLTTTFRGYLKVSHRADGLVDCVTSGRPCKGVAKWLYILSASYLYRPT
jgi:Bacterial regulatory helix-turn-helix protein, lysR family